ncbi:hypothetical protein [Oceaniglobus ichthyenteri]|nr:hypothetical protein [Oceaniglobus ichthyenteri]
MSRRNRDRIIGSCGTSFPKVIMEIRLQRAAELLPERSSAGK